MRSFFVQNFGCRASQADGAAIESQLAQIGLDRSREAASADLVVLNTCTVTSTSDDEMRQMVRRTHRNNPAANILVTGCYAQRAPDEISTLPGVSMVVGNSHKTQIASIISAHQNQQHFHGEIHVGDIFADHEFLASPIDAAPGDRSRPNLKIQDGCSNRCSFCIIPSVRGRSRSASVPQILDQVRVLCATYPEIVLTGINLGRWGREPGFNMRLADLLRLILSETDVRRIRLSSVEPMDWSDDLLHLMADSGRIATHVHAPLQSGSDTVLRRMHRKYRPHHYESRVRLARELMPDAAIGADVMVGFPGETKDEFAQTCDFIESLPFTYLHVFPYSERPGTPAAESSAQIPWQIRKERGALLRAIADRKNLEFRRRMLGRSLPAVTLRQSEALTSNYLAVKLGTPREPRQLVNLTIGALADTGLAEQQFFPVLS